jgi:hypothetical protein
MSPWAELQTDFAEGLLDPMREPPSAVVGPAGAPCPKRFAVYRNNVMAGLVDVLAESFPAVRQLVGEAFFAAMATVYARCDPPSSPVLLAYGSGFPDFIGQFEPARELGYLADVARLERLWLDAYHAAEAEPLTSFDFAEVPPDRLGELRVQLHPSLRLVRSPYPVLDIWQVNIRGETPEPIDLEDGAQDVLVLRAQRDVTARVVPPGVAAFLASLGQGESVAEAFEKTQAAAWDFDLAGALAVLISSGAFVGFELAAVDCEAQA